MASASRQTLALKWDSSLWDLWSSWSSQLSGRLCQPLICLPIYVSIPLNFHYLREPNFKELDGLYLFKRAFSVHLWRAVFSFMHEVYQGGRILRENDLGFIPRDTVQALDILTTGNFLPQWKGKTLEQGFDTLPLLSLDTLWQVTEVTIRK